MVGGLRALGDEQLEQCAENKTFVIRKIQIFAVQTSVLQT